MKFKRITSLFLVFSILCASTSVYAGGSSTNVQQKEVQPKVYFFDANGNRTEVNIPIESLKELASKGTTKLPSLDDQTRSIPLPDDDSATRISSVSRAKITHETINFVVESTVGAMFGMSWEAVGRRLVAAVTKRVIVESVWKSTIANAVAGTAVSRAFKFLEQNPTYLEMYTYKAWSTYSNCYIIYRATTYYGTDSTYSSPKSVELDIIMYDSENIQVQ